MIFTKRYINILSILSTIIIFNLFILIINYQTNKKINTIEAKKENEKLNIIYIK